MPNLTQSMILITDDHFLSATVTGSGWTTPGDAAFPRHDSGAQPADFDSGNGARELVFDLGPRGARKLDSVGCVGLQVGGTVLADSYSESNQDATQVVGNGTITAIGQEFTSDGNGTLVSCRFHLAKTLSPTGNATAELYLSDGAAPAEPAGEPLATSGTVDVATLTGALALTTFTFTDAYHLADGVEYFLVLRYAGGDASNYVTAGVDSSAPSHGGNLATEAASAWTGVAGTDLCFYATRNLDATDVSWQVRGADDVAITVAVTDWGDESYVRRGTDGPTPRQDMLQPDQGPEDWQLPGIMSAGRLCGLHLRAEGGEVAHRYWGVKFTNNAASSSNCTLDIAKLFGGWGRMTVNWRSINPSTIRLPGGSTLRKWGLTFEATDEAEIHRKMAPALQQGKRAFIAIAPGDRPEYFLPSGPGGGGEAAMVEIVNHSITNTGDTAVLGGINQFRHSVSLDVVERFNGETES